MTIVQLKDLERRLAEAKGANKVRGKPCVCGHLKGFHRKSGCIAKRADATPGDSYCRCRWFVHAFPEGQRP